MWILIKKIQYNICIKIKFGQFRETKLRLIWTKRRKLGLNWTKLTKIGTELNISHETLTRGNDTNLTRGSDTSQCSLDTRIIFLKLKN